MQTRQKLLPWPWEKQKCNSHHRGLKETGHSRVVLLDLLLRVDDAANQVPEDGAVVRSHQLIVGRIGRVVRVFGLITIVVVVVVVVGVVVDGVAVVRGLDAALFIIVS